MDAAIRERVARRANHFCEYCLMPQELSSIPFEIDHIIARKHGGETVEANLAFSCFYCNSYKGPNIAGIDPDSGEISELFHPRKDLWRNHFRWDGPRLVGRTATARATIAVLEINHPDFVAARQAFIQEGCFPPDTP